MPTKTNYKDYILVFLLIALSTIPFFKQSLGFYLTVFFVLIFYKPVIKQEAIIFLFFVCLLEVYHFYYFDQYDILVVRQILIFFFISTFIIYYTKLSFLTIFNDIIYYFTLISLPVFFIFILFPQGIIQMANSFPGFFVNTFENYGNTFVQVNPIFYNFDFNFYKGRNNGPFWEPTVFASMLIIAQIFNLITSGKLLNKRGVIFSLGIITTFSTTGFIAYFLFLISYFLLSKRVNFTNKVLVSFILISSSLYLFTSLSFLQAKILNEINGVDESIDKFGGDTRLASAVLDYTEVTQEGIFFLLGKGSSSFSRIGGEDKDVLRNCGLTGLLVEWGIIFSILYISLLYYSFKKLAIYYCLDKRLAIVFTMIILILSLSEVLFRLPLFHSFLFIGFIVNRFYMPVLKKVS